MWPEADRSRRSCPFVFNKSFLKWDIDLYVHLVGIIMAFWWHKTFCHCNPPEYWVFVVNTQTVRGGAWFIVNWQSFCNNECHPSELLCRPSALLGLCAGGCACVWINEWTREWANVHRILLPEISSPSPPIQLIANPNCRRNSIRNAMSQYDFDYVHLYRWIGCDSI